MSAGAQLVVTAIYYPAQADERFLFISMMRRNLYRHPESQIFPSFLPWKVSLLHVRRSLTYIRGSWGSQYSARRMRHIIDASEYIEYPGYNLNSPAFAISIDVANSNELPSTTGVNQHGQFRWTLARAGGHDSDTTATSIMTREQYNFANLRDKTGFDFLVSPFAKRLGRSSKGSLLSPAPLRIIVTTLLDPSSVLLTERPKANQRIEDETFLATRARDRMRRTATPLDCLQVGAGSPFFRILPGLCVLSSLDCLEG
ncbi:hypothetical protein C8J56DRAFT_896911 [Mycena floridula]|nr:hypothetical protein C8J56DRAFT_896911 [Mycena floridula]